MSFYTKIKTQLKVKKYVIAALEELKRRGEITSYQKVGSKEDIKVDRSGDIMNISLSKAGTFEIAGDNRVVQPFSDKIKQVYALEAIKDNLPLDFEIATETEQAGEILILLKG